MTAQNHTCAGDIWRGFRYHKCGKTAAHEHEGVMYCKTHHPPTIEEKRKQKLAEYEADANRREAIYKADAEAKAEMNRRAECFPDLLDALRQWANAEATNDAEELQNARSSRDEAIARATHKEQI